MIPHEFIIGEIVGAFSVCVICTPISKNWIPFSGAIFFSIATLIVDWFL